MPFSSHPVGVHDSNVTCHVALTVSAEVPCVGLSPRVRHGVTWSLLCLSCSLCKEAWCPQERETVESQTGALP